MIQTATVALGYFEVAAEVISVLFLVLGLTIGGGGILAYYLAT